MVHAERLLIVAAIGKRHHHLVWRTLHIEPFGLGEELGCAAKRGLYIRVDTYTRKHPGINPESVGELLIRPVPLHTFGWRAMNRSPCISVLFYVQLIASVLLFGCASTPGRDKALYPVMAVAASPDSNLIAVSTNAQEIADFDVSPLRFRCLLTPEGQKKEGKLGKIFQSPPLAFAPDGRLLIGADVGGRVVGWDVEPGSQKFSTPIEPGIVDIAFFPDSHGFITAGPGVAIWTSDTGSLIGTLELPTGTKATSVCVSVDGQAILVGLSNGDIAVYNSANRQLIRTWKAHQVSVTGLAFAPDGKILASSAGLYDPRLWKIDPESLSAEAVQNLHFMTTAAQASRSTQAVVFLAWLLGTVRGFQLVGAPTLGAPPVSTAAATRNSGLCGPRVVFSPNGRYLAATATLPMLAGSLQVFLTDLKSHKTRTIAGIYGCSVAFTRDSKLLITGGLGAPVLWDVETGQKVIIGKGKD
jgi:WD40 repeat protein